MSEHTLIRFGSFSLQYAPELVSRTEDHRRVSKSAIIWQLGSRDLSLVTMEASIPAAVEKKECKPSALDGSSFSEVPKKSSPSSLSREWQHLRDFSPLKWRKRFQFYTFMKEFGGLPLSRKEKDEGFSGELEE
ncbi:hypothetical protein DNTS_018865 [Danionella cerebrum]|uniref:Uncharacterized protein n=1 Tax=Danionella cerebrum TaxID=2873325 RepID=A0A553QES0_9TELE|nr:hypothetical protein DNTS_018865 [Danionella translucida]